jgi:hypothetical protein
MKPEKERRKSRMKVRICGEQIEDSRWVQSPSVW